MTNIINSLIGDSYTTSTLSASGSVAPTNSVPLFAIGQTVRISKYQTSEITGMKNMVGSLGVIESVKKSYSSEIIWYRLKNLSYTWRQDWLEDVSNNDNFLNDKDILI